ncbi:hypothetical protein LO763_08935 [Glycomyces sp. A-F 0318]|uniref:hypothetical protein n=1 Tax=Glycomyces amatae TaxID=2881355 RepID=UPI001E60B631|nr:hypothetical protein [Glycomyces amatae]MCD0443745.1 hypothetical protein [Glycomyces amatae]
MWHAYVDESEHLRDGDAHTYILAAALVADDECEEVRHQVRALHRSGEPKLHWFRLTDSMRERMAKSVAALPALHIVVVRVTEHCRDSERARRKTFARLLYELETRGIDRVTAESRQRKQNDRDVAFVRGLRSSQQIGIDVRLEHVSGPAEPLLWVPDIVAGAILSATRGDDRYRETLTSVLDLVTLENLSRK